MSWTLSTSGAAIAKAGANANSTIIASGATLAMWSDEAEAYVNTITRKDWVAGYNTVTTNFKQVLSRVVSDLIAMEIIAYDMSGYTSLAEAQTMLDKLRDDHTKIVTDLTDDKIKEVML